MRHRKASAIYGIVNQRLRVSHQTLILAVLAVAATWLVWSFAQEVLLSHGLARQAASLRQQNAALQAENHGYQRDIVASTSGAAAEEEARGDGYSKLKEKLYVVGSSPAPTPPRTAAAAGQARAKASPARSAAQGGKPNGLQRFRDWLLHLMLP
jgi:cell division protein FtsB